jgi:mRNA-degrading endonuclease RelE of RelBE toxin-antitoxin system
VLDKTNPLDYNVFMLNTIAELPSYSSFAEKQMSEEERQAIIDYLAEHPKAGDVMQGTGGLRKLRWGKGGRGKSGGVRVIYYYHDERLPLYLLTLFGKNEKANLTARERNMLATLVDTLVTTALEALNEGI